MTARSRTEVAFQLLEGLKGRIHCAEGHSDNRFSSIKECALTFLWLAELAAIQNRANMKARHMFALMSAHMGMLDTLNGFIGKLDDIWRTSYSKRSAIHDLLDLRRELLKIEGLYLRESSIKKGAYDTIEDRLGENFANLYRLLKSVLDPVEAQLNELTLDPGNNDVADDVLVKVVRDLKAGVDPVKLTHFDVNHWLHAFSRWAKDNCKTDNLCQTKVLSGIEVLQSVQKAVYTATDLFFYDVENPESATTGVTP